MTSHFPIINITSVSKLSTIWHMTSVSRRHYFTWPVWADSTTWHYHCEQTEHYLILPIWALTFPVWADWALLGISRLSITWHEHYSKFTWHHTNVSRLSTQDKKCIYPKTSIGEAAPQLPREKIYSWLCTQINTLQIITENQRRTKQNTKWKYQGKNSCFSPNNAYYWYCNHTWLEFMSNVIWCSQLWIDTSVITPVSSDAVSSE